MMLNSMQFFFFACAAVIAVVGSQCDAQPAPSPAPVPLPLPDNPASICTGNTFRQASKGHKSCGQTMYSYEDPDQHCCDALMEYYGVNSTRPSRNCFCVPSYWERIVELEEVTYLQVPRYMKFCKIPYYQAGKGPCAGLPEAEETEADASTSTETPHARSLSRWIKDLKGDGLMTFTFTLGLISAFGFVAMLWPLVADTGLEIYKAVAARRSHL